MDQVIVSLFTEVRRHKPSVIYIPNIDAWYSVLADSLALTTFRTMLKSIPPTDPVLLLATADCEKPDLHSGLHRDFFGFSRKNRMEISRPDRVSRRSSLGCVRFQRHKFAKQCLRTTVGSISTGLWNMSNSSRLISRTQKTARSVCSRSCQSCREKTPSRRQRQR